MVGIWVYTEEIWNIPCNNKIRLRNGPTNYYFLNKKGYTVETNERVHAIVNKKESFIWFLDDIVKFI